MLFRIQLYKNIQSPQQMIIFLVNCWIDEMLSPRKYFGIDPHESRIFINFLGDDG